MAIGLQTHFPQPLSGDRGLGWQVETGFVSRVRKEALSITGIDLGWEDTQAILIGLSAVMSKDGVQLEGSFKRSPTKEKA